MINNTNFTILSKESLVLIDGGKASTYCYFVAGVAGCFVSPLLGVPFFLLTFDYSAF